MIARLARGDKGRVPFTWWDRTARSAVARALAAMHEGRISIADALGTSSSGASSDLCATCVVHRPRVYRRALLGGTVALAESYIDGDWDCDDLTALFQIAVRNLQATERLDRSAWPSTLARRLLHALRSNTRRGSRRNIADHYDLGNEFFRLWLDESWAYSCGIFSSLDSSLHEASLEKFDRVCRKLDLRAGDSVLEIGCGWGGFAVHAAANYDAQVTATTISPSQLKVARQRVEQMGLDRHVRLLASDYRDLRGTFDKLVSIEMIEAVGHRHLDTYFRQCGRLLRREGSFVLQAIVMPESRHRQYLQSVDFIQRYVFPGGCLPSVASILDSVGRTSDLRLVHAEDFAPHYAETLRRWRVNFEGRLDQVLEQGYSEAFIRLWRYYLSYCEAAFAERAIGLVQLTFDKPGCRRDPTLLSAWAAQPESVERRRTSSAVAPQHLPLCESHP